jgi:hypothetical protein
VKLKIGKVTFLLRKARAGLAFVKAVGQRLAGVFGEETFLAMGDL